MPKNKRAKIAPWQLILWPDENGILILPQRIEGTRTARSTKQPSARSGLLSPRSRLLRRVQQGKIYPVSSWFSSSSWRSLSSRIGYSFSKATDHYFVIWMTARLNESAFGALTLREVMGASESDLGLNEETIKRLLIKHTSASGEFCLVDGLLTMR